MVIAVPLKLRKFICILERDTCLQKMLTYHLLPYNHSNNRILTFSTDCFHFFLPERLGSGVSGTGEHLPSGIVTMAICSEPRADMAAQVGAHTRSPRASLARAL